MTLPFHKSCFRTSCGEKNLRRFFFFFPRDLSLFEPENSRTSNTSGRSNLSARSRRDLRFVIHLEEILSPLVQEVRYNVERFIHIYFQIDRMFSGPWHVSWSCRVSEGRVQCRHTRGNVWIGTTCFQKFRERHHPILVPVHLLQQLQIYIFRIYNVKRNESK